MKKLHESEFATLWLGDSRDVLATYGNECVDLVVTDPPYGMEFRSGARLESFEPIANDGNNPEDKAVVFEVIRHAVRMVGQNRHIYVFGPQSLLDGHKVSAVADLVWDKATSGMGNLIAPWGPAHEPLSFATSMFRHGGKTGNDNLPVRLRKGSVLRFPRKTGRKVRHPAEKPIPLLRELIESSSRQGELVLDPFCGSGSTAVAAILSGRRALTVELTEHDAELALGRIKAAERLYRDMVEV